MVHRFLNAPILNTLRSASIHMKHDHNTAQKKFSIKNFFNICDQICSSLRIRSHSKKKFFMKNVIPLLPSFKWRQFSSKKLVIIILEDISCKYSVLVEENKNLIKNIFWYLPQSSFLCLLFWRNAPSKMLWQIFK